jgi:anti-sigma regulatory factor (Ser/Thr protein kinase)
MSIIAGGARAEKPHDHVVGFYERDDELVSAVRAFLAPALSGDGSAVVIATAPHRRAIEAALAVAGWDVDELVARGRYFALDASDTLSAFMRDGRPDPVAFRSVIGTALDNAAADGPIHAFGEMVALLWDEGNAAAAIELESLWNELAQDRVFSLYCAYAMASLEASGDLSAAKRVCDRHSHVIRLSPQSGCATGSVVPLDGEASTRVFVPTPVVIREVRAFVRDVLDAWGEEMLGAEAEIIVAELASNSVLHACSPFRVSLSRTDSEIKLAVRDASAALPQDIGGRTDRHGGRGISIVAALSNAWDTDPEADGKTIWAKLTRSA